LLNRASPPNFAPPNTASQVQRLVDVFDLSVFGEPDSEPRLGEAATVIAPLGFGRDDRRRWAGRTLTRLACPYVDVRGRRRV
jgi:hypothetical protein